MEYSNYLGQKPFLSILTATYNRAHLLPRLYDSILQNTNENLVIEWLIMDDGSKDNTKEVVQGFEENKYLQIKYFTQKNSGKMAAINNLVKMARGMFMMDVDSDDMLNSRCLKLIKENCFEYEDIYAFVFLKEDMNGNIVGGEFKKPAHNTTMFELSFIQEFEGETAMVFNSSIRKLFEHELEGREKFVTEARMYHKMDRYYSIFCFNEPIQIIEYQKDGYTSNIKKIFEKNPYGYYKYFKEILEFDFTNISLKKRLYVLKHYILFSYITNLPLETYRIDNLFNKILLHLLYLPGVLKAKKDGYKTIKEKREFENNMGYNVNNFEGAKEVLKVREERDKKENRKKIIKKVLGMEDESYDEDYKEYLKEEERERELEELEKLNKEHKEKTAKRVEDLIKQARQKNNKKEKNSKNRKRNIIED